MQTFFKEKPRKKKRIKWSNGKKTYCQFTGVYDWCDPHHIFNGNPQRALSEKYGAVIYILPEEHRKLHMDIARLDALKAQWQVKLMAEHNWTQEEWIHIWGMSYL